MPTCHPRNIGTQRQSPNPTPLKGQKDGDVSCLALYLIKPHDQPDLSLLSVQASLSLTCPLAQSALMALEISQAIETLISVPRPSPTSPLHCQRRGRWLKPDGPNIGLLRRDQTRQEGRTPIPWLS